jgi:hypothetical protein
VTSRSRKQEERRALPPRTPALHRRTFLVTFDVNCGELLPGHDFVARGLSDDGHGTGTDDAAAPVQLFSLEYELVPGVPPSEADDLSRHLVGVYYSADVDLPWEPVDGGAIAPFEGGASTHGSRGSWPLPAAARRLTFDLHAVPRGQRWPNDTAAGQLVVDLAAGTARWG